MPMENRVSSRVRLTGRGSKLLGLAVARVTGSTGSSIARFRVSGRRFVPGSPEFVNGGSGPHGFTNRPGSLSRSLSLPISRSHLSVSSLTLTLPISSLSLSHSLPSQLSLFVSHLSISLSMGLARRRTEKGRRKK